MLELLLLIQSFHLEEGEMILSIQTSLQRVLDGKKRSI